MTPARFRLYQALIGAFALLLFGGCVALLPASLASTLAEGCIEVSNPYAAAPVQCLAAAQQWDALIIVAGVVGMVMGAVWGWRAWRVYRRPLK